MYAMASRRPVPRAALCAAALLLALSPSAQAYSSGYHSCPVAPGLGIPGHGYFPTPATAGAFSLSLTVAAGHHVAYGIELVGPNARASDLAGLGVVQVSAVPEPATALLLSVGVIGLMLRRRRC